MADMSNPSLTPTMLLESLVTAGVLTPQRILSLLGEARHSISLNDLEMTLVAQDVLSMKRLSQLKGMLTGRPILEDPATPIRVEGFPADLVRHAGALLLDRDPLTVACVEDLSDNLDIISGHLNTTNYEVWLMTAPMFDALHNRYYQGGEDQGSLSLPSSIHHILDEAARRRASDIHLSVGLEPSVRVDGTLIKLAFSPLTPEWLEREMATITTEEKMDFWRTHADADYAYNFGAARFRVNLGGDRAGMTVAMRKIPTIIPTMEDLGLPAAVQELITIERGLVLVTGPTGSGKSTTLAAMLGEIARSQSRHLITLEDPVEFFMPSGKSVVHQRELGQSFFSFPAGLRQALRQDPDVILVGEMRDIETIRTAITAADTGHLVFATLHTTDAPATVSRIVTSFPGDEQDQIRAQLSSVLKGVVSQALVPLVSSKGRVAAIEVMLSTPAISNNLRKTDGHTLLTQTMETSSRDGMRTMEMALIDLVKRGLIAVEEAERRAPDRESFKMRMERDDF